MSDDNGPFSFSVVNLFNGLFPGICDAAGTLLGTLEPSLKLAVPGTFSHGNNGPGFWSTRFFLGSMEIMGVKTPYKL